jgi:hypothetical protein
MMLEELPILSKSDGIDGVRVSMSCSSGSRNMEVAGAYVCNIKAKHITFELVDIQLVYQPTSW